MSNPYRSPVNTPHQSGALNAVNAPAVALIVVSSIAIVLGLFGLAADAFLVLSGMVEKLDQLKQGGMSKYTQITVRTVWGIILVGASSFVFYGAMKMKSGHNYGLAKAASITAMIPCIGPCLLLGIPFGIWAFVVLNKPEVKQAFRPS